MTAYYRFLVFFILLTLGIVLEGCLPQEPDSGAEETTETVSEPKADEEQSPFAITNDDDLNGIWAMETQEIGLVETSYTDSQYNQIHGIDFNELPDGDEEGDEDCEGEECILPPGDMPSTLYIQSRVDESMISVGPSPFQQVEFQIESNGIARKIFDDRYEHIYGEEDEISKCNVLRSYQINLTMGPEEGTILVAQQFSFELSDADEFPGACAEFLEGELTKHEAGESEDGFLGYLIDSGILNSEVIGQLRKLTFTMVDYGRRIAEEN